MVFVVVFVVVFFFFFFKQKTAYEIVSRDWSSDVCSSDLGFGLCFELGFEQDAVDEVWKAHSDGIIPRLHVFDLCASQLPHVPDGQELDEHQIERSEERRVGKECRSRWSPYH